MIRNVLLFLNEFMLAETTYEMDLPFDLGTCKVVSQRCILELLVSLHLAKEGVLLAVWNYSLYNSRFTLGAVACCLSQKLLKQF